MTHAQPTVFHVTHWRAGSQWVYRILLHIAEETGTEIVPPLATLGQVLETAIRPGAIYPTIYLTAEQFSNIVLPARASKFVVICDLRDTLVSVILVCGTVTLSSATLRSSVENWRRSHRSWAHVRNGKLARLVRSYPTIMGA